MWLLHSIVFKYRLEYSVCSMHTTCLCFLFCFYLMGTIWTVHIVFLIRVTIPLARSKCCSCAWHIRSVSKSQSVRVVSYPYGNDTNSLRTFQTPTNLEGMNHESFTGNSADPRAQEQSLCEPRLALHPSAVPCTLQACRNVCWVNEWTACRVNDRQ